MSELRGKVPAEVEERVEQAVQTFRENHKDPANLALHGIGYYAILKGVVRFLRHKRFRGLFLIGVGVAMLLAGHEIEGTPAFSLMRSGDGKLS
ncbi:MAG: hypothetical protein ACRDKJ_00435 [Actinomycetota bacterium]